MPLPGHREPIERPPPPTGVKIFAFEDILPPSGSKTKYPLPRSGHRIVCDDANVYSFGGYLEKVDQSGTGTFHHIQKLFHEVWKWNYWHIIHFFPRWCPFYAILQRIHSFGSWIWRVMSGNWYTLSVEPQTNWRRIQLYSLARISSFSVALEFHLVSPLRIKCTFVIWSWWGGAKFVHAEHHQLLNMEIGRASCRERA